MCQIVGHALPVLVLASLAAVLPPVHGFRTGSPGQDTLVEDAEVLKHEVELEAEAVEKKIEAVADKLGSAEAKTKPIKGSFRVGDSLDTPELKMKVTVSIWHESPAGASATPWFEAKITAKDAALGAKFVKALTTQLSAFGFDQFLTVSLQGEELTLSSVPLPCDDNCTRAMESFSRHIEHVDLTEEALDFDFAGMLKDHSRTPIFQELYRGLKVGIDAALTPAIEESLALLAGPEKSEAVRVMTQLFQGLFFDIRVQYASEAVRDALNSVPGLNVTADDYIALYRLLGERIPLRERGHPLYVAAVDLLEEADNCLASFNSLEVKGLPSGLRAMLKYENINPFAIFNTLVKEAGIDKVLRNETVAA